MPFWDRNKNSQELRVIKTARDKDSINRAAKSGLNPLIKKVEPSDKIRCWGLSGRLLFGRQ